MSHFKEWLLTAAAGIVGGTLGMLIPIIIGFCCGVFSDIGLSLLLGPFVLISSLFGGCFGAMRSGTIAGRWIDRYR